MGLRNALLMNVLSAYLMGCGQGVVDFQASEAAGSSEKDIEDEVVECKMKFQSGASISTRLFPGNIEVCRTQLFALSVLNSWASQTAQFSATIAGKITVLALEELRDANFRRPSGSCGLVPAQRDSGFGRKAYSINLYLKNTEDAESLCREFCQRKDKVVQYGDEAKCILQTYDVVSFANTNDEVTRAISWVALPNR